MGETIVLPKSGVVLPWDDYRGHNSAHENAVMLWAIDHLGQPVHGIHAAAEMERDGQARTPSGNFQAKFFIGSIRRFTGTRDECIAWLDARVLETRAALTPPGHVLVGPDARETVARELWEFNRVCEWTEATEDEKTDYLLGADAVLRAIGVRGGA